ncbi:MAG: SRPBCC domain-containing protein [Patescibacteria group bacterium]|nr:SRPBCC domain-containing protein [Patescibacteria group bacterium]
MKTIKQTEIFKAEPQEIYEMFMDSKKHADFTGEGAEIDPRVGEEFRVQSNYAIGKNLELVPGKKIVQSWRAADWPEGHFSKITIELVPVKEGTKMFFTQIDVPDEFCDDISQGWKDYYWEPLKDKLG